jgi:glycerophosphoryl diester phosphodiesterase
MQASFEASADIVEVDVRFTIDGQFTVFHDRMLDRRTNGSGVTREHSMAELKTLGLGYGYRTEKPFLSGEGHRSDTITG